MLCEAPPVYLLPQLLHLAPAKSTSLTQSSHSIQLLFPLYVVVYHHHPTTTTVTIHSSSQSVSAAAGKSHESDSSGGSRMMQHSRRSKSANRAVQGSAHVSGSSFTAGFWVYDLLTRTHRHHAHTSFTGGLFIFKLLLAQMNAWSIGWPVGLLAS